MRISLGDTPAKGSARVTVLSAEPAAENSLDKPTNVAPLERSVAGLDLTLGARSLTVLRVPVR